MPDRMADPVTVPFFLTNKLDEDHSLNLFANSLLRIFDVSTPLVLKCSKSIRWLGPRRNFAYCVDLFILKVGFGRRDEGGQNPTQSIKQCC